MYIRHFLWLARRGLIRDNAVRLARAVHKGLDMGFLLVENTDVLLNLTC